MYAPRIAKLQAARDGVLYELRSEDYQLLCLEYHGGSFPLECVFCGQQVTGWGRQHDGAVHHMNHDRRDNTAGNLEPVHGSCHNSYHGEMPRAAYSMTDAHRKAIGDSVRGTVHTEQTRSNMSEAAKKKYAERPDLRAAVGERFSGPKSEEHKKKISESQRAMQETCECGATYRPCHRRYHQRQCLLVVKEVS